MVPPKIAVKDLQGGLVMELTVAPTVRLRAKVALYLIKLAAWASGGMIALRVTPSVVRKRKKG